MAFLMALAVVSPAQADILHCHDEHAEEMQDQHSGHQSQLQKEESSKDKNSQAKDHDCHCPLHRGNCGHAHNLSFQKENASFDLGQFFANAYLDSTFRIKPGPFLDGPFQPPRA